MCKPTNGNIKRSTLADVSLIQIGAEFKSNFTWEYPQQYLMLEKVWSDSGVLMAIHNVSSDIISILWLPKFGSGGYVDTTRDPESAALLAKANANRPVHRIDIIHVDNESTATALRRALEKEFPEEKFDSDTIADMAGIRWHTFKHDLQSPILARCRDFAKGFVAALVFTTSING